ncbi:hypothetical protein AJ79_03407 [Helicocarpus griseus UAMH5409]|uniref:Uncharacterized protein n=1 Tax=Helicocarpus griseus UAMH5409 TaxID=1447875 RepID=A0A2B7XY39_9EURO|nr:hypothetical protein AJ79_03407 [Helicocarpus griseus UAMH5409]
MTFVETPQQISVASTLEHPNTPIFTVKDAPRDFLKQVDPSTWLIGNLILHRSTSLSPSSPPDG